MNTQNYELFLVFVLSEIIHSSERLQRLYVYWENIKKKLWLFLYIYNEKTTESFSNGAYNNVCMRK